MIESTEAFRKFANGQAWNQLDFRTQQQIRLMAILEQATAKYGNTLANSVNGRISLFKSLLKDSALNVGNAMLPVINAMMPVLNSLAMVLKNVTAKLAEFIALMFNKKATSKAGSAAGGIQDVQKAAEGAGNALGDLGDAGQGLGDATGGAADNLDDTAKSAKKAVKELMGLAGFDEITTLNVNKDDGGGGGGSGGSPGGGGGGKGGPGNGAFNDILPEVELTDMDNQFKSIFDGWLPKFKELADLFGKGFNAAFRADGIDRLMAALGRIQKVVGEIFSDPRVTTAFETMLAKWAYALGQFTGSIATVALGIGIFIAESIANGLERQKERIIQALTSLFTNLGNIGQSAGNIAQSLSNTFYEVMTSSGAIRIGSAITSALLSAGSTIIDIGSRFGADLMGGLETIVTDNAPKLEKAMSGFFEAIAPLAETVEEIVNDVGVAFSRFYDEHVSPFIKSFSEGISEIVGTLLDAWSNHINPFISRFSTGVKTLYEENKPLFADLAKAIGLFVGVWKTIEFLSVLEQAGGAVGALSSMKTAFDNLKTSLHAVTIAKIQDKLETMALNAMYAKDFIVNTGRLILEKGKEAVAWTVSTAGKAADTVASWAATAGTTALSAATWALNTALAVLTSPITLVVAAIAALVAVGYLLVTNWETVKQVASDVWGNMVAFFEETWEKIKQGIDTAWQVILGLFQTAWDGIVRIFSPIGTWFGERWSDVKAKLAEVGSWFTSKFQEGWSGLTSIFQKLGGWFSEQWGKVKSNLGEVGSWFSGKFNEAYEGVKRAFSGITSFFSGIWSQIKSTFTHVGTMVGEAIGGAVRGVINGVLATVENTINSGINLLNGAIGVINKLPGVSIGGFSHISLPRLARGGIVDSPTIAMIGEAGKEVVMPLENTGFLQTMGRVVGGAVVNALGGYSGQGSNGFSGEIVINIGDREFGRFAIDAINEEQARAGQLLLNI